MWETRPPRITKEEGANPPIAGVCEGIGARYEVDPTLVRVAFAALAFVLGGGIFMYLLCWFTMPRLGTQTSPADAIFTPKERLNKTELNDRNTGYLLFIGLLFFFPSITFGVEPRTTLAPLIGTFAAFAGWWALHQRVPEPPPALRAHYDAVRTGPDPAQPHSLSGNPEPILSENPVNPEPSPELEATNSSRYTDYTGYTDYSGYSQYSSFSAQPGYSYNYSAGTAYSTSAPKRNRPLWLWLPIALALSAVVFAAGMFASEIRHGDWSRFGQADVGIKSAASLHPIENTIGDLTVDLTDLEVLEEPATLDVTGTMGSIEVYLPKNHGPIEVNCTVKVGDTDCPNERLDSSGGGAGELLTLNLHQKIGSIRVAGKLE